MCAFHIRTGVLLLFLLGTAAGMAEGSEVGWVPWSPDVLVRARNEGRLVLVDLTAEWCKYCKKMDATTYRDPQVVDMINRDFIAVRADEKDQSGLAQRYRQVGRPGTVILNSEGVELIARTGYLKPQWMLWLLQAVIQNPVAEAHRN